MKGTNVGEIGIRVKQEILFGLKLYHRHKTFPVGGGKRSPSPPPYPPPPSPPSPLPPPGFCKIRGESENIHVLGSDKFDCLQI
jgi:hypothetical protein